MWVDLVCTLAYSEASAQLSCNKMSVTPAEQYICLSKQHRQNPALHSPVPILASSLYSLLITFDNRQIRRMSTQDVVDNEGWSLDRYCNPCLLKVGEAGALQFHCLFAFVLQLYV